MFKGSGRSPVRRRKVARTALVAFLVVGVASTSGAASAVHTDRSGHMIQGRWEVRSLDGSGNNRHHPEWGKAGTIYPRVAPARYVDGRSEPFAGPDVRYLSNRVFNDSGQPLYSARGVSQWGFVWGQFLDHTMALRLGRRETSDPGEQMNIPYDNADPLESFPNDLGFIDFGRSAPAPGTGVTNPREQINQNSSFIDALTVYGTTAARLEWMREGVVDGNLNNNGARLLLPGGYLPRRGARGNADLAPNMVTAGVDPARIAVAGDQRANENPPLLAIQTLFAREHNRIVQRLPQGMREQDKFEIARAVVIAEQQYITYNEFLPTMGVRLPRYQGYRSTVDASLTNEFATVGYRAHSLIRGEFKVRADAGRYSAQTLDRLRELGIGVSQQGGVVELTIPLGEAAFFNPDLLEIIQLGPMLEGLGRRSQNNNDEQITNLLRSFTVDLPVDANPLCLDDPALPACIRAVNDLAAVDIARGRDHGMPTYNQLRRAYGLAPVTSFTQITGEATERFPRDAELTRGREIDDPDSMDFIKLFDAAGRPTTTAKDDATSGIRRTTLAARLKAIYQDVNKVDAFVGMIAEAHLPGTEFGQTQQAIWQRQFTALRDGDRFFYDNYPLLDQVRSRYGIDYHTSLGDIIARNTGIARDSLARNVFRAYP